VARKQGFTTLEVIMALIIAIVVMGVIVSGVWLAIYKPTVESVVKPCNCLSGDNCNELSCNNCPICEWAGNVCSCNVGTT